MSNSAVRGQQNLLSQHQTSFESSAEKKRFCSAVAYCCRLALLKVSGPFIGLLALIPNLAPGAAAPVLLLLLLKVLGPLLVWLCAKLQIGEVLDPPATMCYSSALSAECILGAGPVMPVLWLYHLVNPEESREPDVGHCRQCNSSTALTLWNTQCWRSNLAPHPLADPCSRAMCCAFAACSAAAEGCAWCSAPAL